MRIGLLGLIMMIGSQTFAAGSGGRSAAPGSGGSRFGFGLMALSSSTKQGGQGPQGSTLLTHFEYLYQFGPDFGLGFFYLSDKQGSSETDTAYGPKLDYAMGPFYVDLGYAISVNRAYTDRSIANETGSGMYYGIGTRFNLGMGQGSGWYFFANYKFRTYTIEKQDGVNLSEKIIQTDNYPVFGVGYKF